MRPVPCTGKSGQDKNPGTKSAQNRQLQEQSWPRTGQRVGRISGTRDSHLGGEGIALSPANLAPDGQLQAQLSHQMVTEVLIFRYRLWTTSGGVGNR